MFWNIWHQNIFAVVFLHWKDQVHWSYIHGSLWVGRWTMLSSSQSMAYDQSNPWPKSSSHYRSNPRSKSSSQWPWPIKFKANIIIMAMFLMTNMIIMPMTNIPISWSSCWWPIHQYQYHHQGWQIPISFMTNIPTSLLSSGLTNIPLSSSGLTDPTATVDNMHIDAMANYAIR